MAGTVEQFGQLVHQRTAGTPYVVTPTATGFDLSIDLTNAGFWGNLHQMSLSNVFIHHVACDQAAGTYKITDEEREVTWSPGPHGPVPRLSASARVGMGRSVSVQREITIGRKVGVSGGVTVSRFSSEEGRRMITDAAAQAGWTSAGLPTVAKIGIVAAAAVVVIAIVVAVLLIVLL